MFKNPFKVKVKKGNSELITKVMKEIERDYMKKHGSLDGLTETKLLEMANSYIAFELGMVLWREWVHALYQSALRKNIYSKWEETFGEFLLDIAEGGKYTDDKTDFIEHMRLIYQHAKETEMTESQKIQTTMAFAVAIRILGYHKPFEAFMEESSIPKDKQYQEMFRDFFEISRL